MRTLFTNAHFWSPDHQDCDQLLVEDELILAVGDACNDFESDATVDLRKAFVIPAFIDGHAHPIFAGREAAGPKVNNLQTLAEIQEAVRKFADSNPDIPWIIGGAYEAAIIPGGNFDSAWLDEVVSDRPVVLHAVDHHTIWVNSKALELAGISAATKDPEGGSIARRSDGSIQGTLREPAAIALVLDVSPGNTIQSDVAAIKYACREFMKVGVAAAIDSWCEKDMARAYIAAANSGDLTIPFNLSFLATPTTWLADIDEFNSLREETEQLNDPSILRANSIKFLLDGALSAGTAFLTQPYLDDPRSFGIQIWSDEDLLRAAIAFDALGYQLHMHAIGDAAVHQALNTIEAMQQVNPYWDRRPVIVHAQLICDEDLPRFHALGVIANIQPLWCYLDPMNKELIEPRIGYARNNRQYRLRTLLDSQATIAFGSDWPVTSHVPLEAINVPVFRKYSAVSDSEPWVQAEAITFDESLKAYTVNAAYQMFREEERGTLAAGKRADFIVLRDLKIESIYFAGKLYSSKESE